MLIKINSKKSQEIERSYLIYILFFLALLVVLVFFMTNFEENVGDKAFSEVCNKYLQAHMAGKRLFDSMMKGGNENPCTTEEVIVEENKPYEVMEKVADKMTECYNTYYRGEANLFSGEKNKELTFCSICHKISFDNKSIKIDNEEWNSFLASQKYKTGEPYLEIFTGKEYYAKYMAIRNTFFYEVNTQATGDISAHYSIDTKDKYITLFVYNKTEKPTLFQRVVGNAIKGVVIGSVVVVGGVIIYFTAGAATPGVISAASIVIGTVSAGGFAGGAVAAGATYLKYKELDNGSKWTSSIQIVPYDTENIKKINCNVVVGMSGKGIEQKPY